MKKLFINDQCYGEVEAYRQDRAERCWVFDMGMFKISVNFKDIKIFHSSRDIEITTNE